MSPDESFASLLRGVRARDPDAARELVRQYEPFIRRAVRARLLEAGMTSLLDSVDLSQSVLASFFLRVAGGQFHLSSPEDLVKLLTAMARNKLRHHLRKQHAQRRDCRRVAADAALADTVASPAPSPVEQLANLDLLQQLHQRLTQDERLLVELRHEGLDWAGVAARLGDDPVRLRKRLSRALDRVAGQLGLDE